MWAVLFNLCIAIVVAGLLLRSVRHYENRVEAKLPQLDRDDAAHGHKFALAWDEIQALTRRKTDQAIAELWVETNGTTTVGCSPNPTAWTPEKNTRRCELIDREIDGIITPSEAAELAELQNQMRRHVNRVAPLPLEELRKLRDELLRKAATAQNQSSQ